MPKNGLLFIYNPNTALNLFMKTSEFVKEVLYIVFNEKAEKSAEIVSSLIFKIYSEASYYFNKLDVRFILKADITKIITLHPIDVIILDSGQEKQLLDFKNSVVNVRAKLKFKIIDNDNITQVTEDLEPVKRYEFVSLNGTFDRLHNGHKILLSQAILRATKQVTVGIANDNLIQTKILWELIEPLEKRIESVQNFLKDINPDMAYYVVGIQESHELIKEDPRTEMIIVSEETCGDAVKINEERQKLELTTVDIYVTKVAEDYHPELSVEEKQKISSSNQRMRLLGTLLKSPVPNPLIPDWPYVVGLAGTIAGGKTNIAEKLRTVGAAILNCDDIAPELYRPGNPFNQTLFDTFGVDIKNKKGDLDKTKLFQKIFSEESLRDKLYEVLFPAIIEEARKRIQAMGEQGYKVVILEGSEMIRAKWYIYCHQVWAVIIPPNEALRRIVDRNGFSEFEAELWMSGYPSNIENVAQANVVLSPYWSYEHTQKQIDRAWRYLQEYLENRK